MSNEAILRSLGIEPIIGQPVPLWALYEIINNIPMMNLPPTLQLPSGTVQSTNGIHIRKPLSAGEYDALVSHQHNLDHNWHPMAPSELPAYLPEITHIPKWEITVSIGTEALRAICVDMDNARSDEAMYLAASTLERTAPPSDRELAFNLYHPDYDNAIVEQIENEDFYMMPDVKCFKGRFLTQNLTPDTARIDPMPLPDLDKEIAMMTGGSK